MAEEVGTENPVPLHRRKHPDLDVEGCFGCKAAGIRFNGVERMKANRAEGITQQDLKREMYADWKRDGIDVRKAGSTSPTSGPLL